MIGRAARRGRATVVRTPQRLRALLATSLLALGLAPPAAAQQEGVWSVGAGAFGVKDRDDTDTVLDLEYRFAPRRWAITPLVGVLGTDEGGYHLRAGFGRDFPLGERFSALVTFAAGFYDQGNGKDLGEHVQFRSALDLGVRLRRGLRLGVSVAHLSNASLEERNPGVETLTLTLAVVPGRLGPAAVRP